MPRKKSAPEEANLPTPETTESTAPAEAAESTAPKPRRSRKATVAPEAAAPVEASAPAAKRTRKLKAPEREPEPVIEVAPATEPKPARRSRAAKAEPEAPVAKPSRTRSRAKASIPSAEESDLTDGTFTVVFRARTVREEAPVAAPVVTPAPAQPEAKGNRKRKEAVPAPKPVVELTDEELADVPLVWRPKGARPAITESEPEPAPETTEEERPSRRRRGRRPPKAETETGSEEAPAVVEPEEAAVPAPAPEPPKPVGRPIVPIPPHAPQVIVREGVPTLVRNGKVFPPIAFFGNAEDERRAQNMLAQARMASEAGVHLYSVILDFEVSRAAVDESVAFAGFLLGRLVEQDPEAQLILRVTFRAPKDWESKYPKARYRSLDGASAEPSLADDDFWGEAADCLKSLVRKLRMLPLAGNLMGIHLDRGEWFLAEGQGYDNSKAATEKFRQWARLRYGNDEVALRANWFDGSVRFDNIEVPDWQPKGPDGERFVRSSRKQRRYVDYHLYLSDEAVTRIADLAHATKEASEGEFLVGTSYGYTFEWSHPASGHLSLGKLLRTPEIDFIAGPPSYRNREPSGTCPFPGPIDSFPLNGKLYLSEEDFKTSLSTGVEPDDFNPALKTPQALDSVHWRGAGAALAHGAGVCWMDLWGNGWLNSASIWERAEKVRQALTLRMAAPTQDPDVIVFVDERALAYLVDQNAFRLLIQNVRESVLRAGLSAGFYLLSDLAHREHFPEGKLYLFLNAWDVRPELRAAIKDRLQRDDKVLFWLYSAGLFDGGRDSLERVREVTGIALKPQPFASRSGTTILNRRHPLCEAFPERQLSAITQLEPSYFAIPEGALVLGEYSQTGLPSFVVKPFEGETDAGGRWTSVFLGEPHVNPQLIRALATMAGAHIWNFHDDVAHVSPPFLTVHCSGAGMRTIALPSNWSAYNLLTGQWVPTESFHLRFHANEGSTHLFLVGNHAEIEHLLQRSPEDLLRVDAIPPKDTNVRIDMTNFDVPIMKLGEWIETADTDENADEWFLRPIAIEDESPAPLEEETSERGRRRRRRRRGRDRSDEIATARPEPSGTVVRDDDLDMGIVFRKRT